MQIKYEPLLTIRPKHEYFPEGNCPALSLVPTTETERVMRSLGIRMVARDFGTELFYNAGAMPQGQLLQTEAPVRLSFILRPEDALFQNYTALPEPAKAPSIRYLTNINPQPDQPAGKFIVAAGHLIAISPQTFNFQVGTLGGLISVLDELENVLHTFPASNEDSEERPTIWPTTEDEAELRVDLSKESPGLYTLKEGDRVAKTFFLPPQNWQSGDEHLISIYLGDTETHGKHLISDGEVTPAFFDLIYPVRETKWRYHLIDSNNGGYNNFQLVDFATQQPLAPPADPPVTKTMPDGSTAVVLTTEALIPLQKRPGNRFLLKMSKAGSARTTPITIQLPSAEATRISLDELRPPDESGPPVFYSDLYVYL